MPKIFINIILLLGTAVVGLLYLAPSWQDFKNTRRDIKNLGEISAELDEILASRDSLIDSINRISKEDLRRIDQALPQGPKAAEMLVILEGMAAGNGVAVKRVDLTSAVEAKTEAGGQPRPTGQAAGVRPGGAFSEFPLGLGLAGNYDSFKKFLRDLESGIRLTDVQEISFTAPDKTGTFEFSLKLKTYYQ